MIPDTRPTNITRTWSCDVAHRLDGAVVMTTHHTVTLSADHAGQITAMVDGAVCAIRQADDVLRDAGEFGRTLVGETRVTPFSGPRNWKDQVAIYHAGGHS